MLIPQEAYRRLKLSATNGPAAIFLDQPIARQFALSRALLPEANRAGILLGQRATKGASSVRQAAGLFALDLEIVTIGSDTNPAAAS